MDGVLDWNKISIGERADICYLLTGINATCKSAYLASKIDLLVRAGFFEAGEIKEDVAAGECVGELVGLPVLKLGDDNGAVMFVQAETKSGEPLLIVPTDETFDMFLAEIGTSNKEYYKVPRIDLHNFLHSMSGRKLS